MRITEQMIKERDEWLDVVSELTGINQQDIMGKSRVEDVVMARHLLTWVMHSLRGYSYPMCGRLLKCNPSTATHRNGIIANWHHTKEMQTIIDKLKARNEYPEWEEAQCHLIDGAIEVTEENNPYKN